MNISERLFEKYQTLNDEKEKTLFISEVISFVNEITIQRADLITQLTAERDNLKNKVSRASTLIDEAQGEAVKAKKATINDTKKKLQIARDRLVAIASTSNILGSQINDTSDKAIMIDTLNNIIKSTGIVVDELSAVGLWDLDEDKPVITPFEVVVLTPKKRTNKKKNPNTGDEQMQL